MIENSLPEGAPDGLTIEQLSDDATLQDAAEQYVKLVLTAGNSVAQVGAAALRPHPPAAARRSPPRRTCPAQTVLTRPNAPLPP